MQPATIRTKTLINLIGCSRSHIYAALLKDPTFPRPFKTGKRELSWLRKDVEGWLEQKARSAQ
jgi:predicted DNA-binding transcriptional regulator AlpA